MKQINVRNLGLQFDEGAYDGSPLEQARKMIQGINEALVRVPEACPQLTTDLSEADVEVTEGDDGEGTDSHLTNVRIPKVMVYKHVVTVTVLSTTPALDAALGEDWTLADLHDGIDSGDCIGHFKVTNTIPLADRGSVEKELKAIGNDGSFFDAELGRSDVGPDEPFQRLPNGVRGKAGVLWHNFGSKAARIEGWDLYTRDNGELEIEYIAEPQEVPELVARGIVDPPFNADDDVIRHCLAKAREGSRLHQLALYLEGRIADRDCWVPAELLDLRELPSPLASLPGTGQ
jgi:hypothetical protein